MIPYTKNCDLVPCKDRIKHIIGDRMEMNNGSEQTNVKTDDGSEYLLLVNEKKPCWHMSMMMSSTS